MCVCVCAAFLPNKKQQRHLNFVAYCSKTDNNRLVNCSRFFVTIAVILSRLLWLYRQQHSSGIIIISSRLSVRPSVRPSVFYSSVNSYFARRELFTPDFNSMKLSTTIHHFCRNCWNIKCFQGQSSKVNVYYCFQSPLQQVSSTVLPVMSTNAWML